MSCVEREKKTRQELNKKFKFNNHHKLCQMTSTLVCHFVPSQHSSCWYFRSWIYALLRFFCLNLGEAQVTHFLNFSQRSVFIYKLSRWREVKFIGHQGLSLLNSPEYLNTQPLGRMTFTKEKVLLMLWAGLTAIQYIAEKRPHCRSKDASDQRWRPPFQKKKILPTS